VNDSKTAPCANLRQLILGTVAALSFATAAHARQWYMVNAKDARCEPMAVTMHGLAPTPYRWEQHLRNAGGFQSLKTETTASGGELVIMTGKASPDSQQQSWLFFTDANDCTAAITLRERSGGITDPSQLQ
jgi:hypothetical protein